MNTADDNNLAAGRRMMTAAEQSLADRLANTPTASRLEPDAAHGNAATHSGVAKAMARLAARYADTASSPPTSPLWTPSPPSGD